MKTKNMKKALSLFLAVLMIALALPFTLLTVAAEEEAVTIKNVTFLAKKTGTSSGDVGFRGGSGVVNSYDGNLTTVAQSYGFSSYFPTYYLDSNNAFAADTTTNPINGGLGKYYAIFVVELNELSVLEDMTLWSRQNTDGGRAHTNFTNDAYDIYYSADGTSYTAVSGASFTGMTGDGTNAGANSALYSEERTVSENVYYGHKIDMKDVVAKYVAIAVASPTKHSNKDAVLREVEFGGKVVSDTVTVTKTATYTTEATDKVYNSILADDENVTAKDIDASYSDAHKLYALGITGIPQSGTVELEVTPYFIPVGTDVKVYGDAATFEFVDGEVNESVKVMAYNICNQNDDELGTLNERVDYIAAQINFVNPDIVMLNEAHEYGNHLESQDLDMNTLVGKCGESYGIVEFKANESTNVILYKTDKFNLESSEYLYIGKGTGTAPNGDTYDRDAAIAKLVRKSDNKEIVAVSTHLSVEGGTEQIRALLSHLKNNYGDIEHRIIAGDFNAQSDTVNNKNGKGQNNKYYHESSVGLYDYTYVDANTKVDVTGTYGDLVLDYIYSTNSIANNYRVIKAANADKASDHYAVYAALLFN